MNTPPRGEARGVLLEQGPGRIVLGLPTTDYQLHLAVDRAPAVGLGKRIVGTIRGEARRIDVVRTGGRYVEPVYGRPRRVQGEIVAIDAAGQAVTVDAGVPFVCRLDGRQRAEQFKVGDFVAFDVLPGATFTPSP